MQAGAMFSTAATDPVGGTASFFMVCQKPSRNLFGSQNHSLIVWIPSPSISECAPDPSTSAAHSNVPWSFPKPMKCPCSTTWSCKVRWLGEGRIGCPPENYFLIPTALPSRSSRSASIRMLLSTALSCSVRTLSANAFARSARSLFPLDR